MILNVASVKYLGRKVYFSTFGLGVSTAGLAD